MGDGIAELLAGQEAIVAAVSGRRDGDPARIPALARRLLEAAEAAAVPRLLWIGGAGSLEIVPGLRGVDSPSFPTEVRPEALAQAEALELLRAASTPVDWAYFSPAAELAADLDGGRHTVAAGDRLLRDVYGRSRIGIADFARAALDELESPRFHRQRFTIASVQTW